MGPASELVADREYPKHKDPQNMVQEVVDDMIAAIPPQPPTAERNHLPVKLCIEVPEYKSPSIKKKKERKKRSKERSEFGVRDRPAMGRGTREGWEGRESNRPSDRASRKLWDSKDAIEGWTSWQSPPPPEACDPTGSPLSAACSFCLHHLPQARPLDPQAGYYHTSESRRQTKENQSVASLLLLPWLSEILTCPPDLYESRSSSWAGPNPVARPPPSFSQLSRGCRASQPKRKRV